MTAPSPTPPATGPALTAPVAPTPSPLGVAPTTTPPAADPADDGGNPTDGVDFSSLTLEEAQEQLKNMTTALTRANKQARDARLRAAKPTPPPTKPKAPADGTPPAVDADAIKAAARAETEGALKPVIVRNAAAAALSAAGVSLPQDKDKRSTLVKRLTSMMDLDAITVAADGELEGLEDEVELLKTLVPELFRLKKPPPAKIDGDQKPTPPAKPLTPTEKLASMVFPGSFGTS